MAAVATYKTPTQEYVVPRSIPMAGVGMLCGRFVLERGIEVVRIILDFLPSWTTLEPSTRTIVFCLRTTLLLKPAGSTWHPVLAWLKERRPRLRAHPLPPEKDRSRRAWSLDQNTRRDDTRWHQRDHVGSHAAAHIATLGKVQEQPGTWQRPHLGLDALCQPVPCSNAVANKSVFATTTTKSCAEC